MSKIWFMISICGLIFAGCKSNNNVYSNASLHRAYKQDPRWNYRGYDPDAIEDDYRRYNPDRKDHIMEELNSRKDENTKEERN